MEGGEEEDRISQLPDPILQHIISFVDIKQAVQTTILSTRWHNLWLSLTELDFNFTRIAVNGGFNLMSWQGRRAFSHLFTNFINHFLSRRDDSSTTRKFHLSLNDACTFESFDYDSDPNATFMEKCVDYAVKHGVEELHLDGFWVHHPLKLPAAFFASKTLRELKLRPSSGGIHFPKRFSSLPHLKTLHLLCADFIDDDDAGFNNYSFTLEPFSGYPELENLTLSSCRISGLVISGPNLASLEINYEGNEWSRPLVKEINCPKLTSFRYEGYSPLSCSNVNLPLLEKACVNIPRNHGFKHSKRTTSQCISLLHQLGNAKIVTLTLDTIKALEKDRRVMEQTPSPFPKMKCLKLKKGRREMPAVPQRVMNYLTKGCLCGDSLIIEFPEGVSVTEIEYLDYLFDEDGDEPVLGCLFQLED